MVDVWRWWDEEVKNVGRPDVAAADMTDAQLLALLRDRAGAEREMEKRAISEELMHRLKQAEPNPRLR